MLWVRCEDLWLDIYRCHPFTSMCLEAWRDNDIDIQGFSSTGETWRWQSMWEVSSVYYGIILYHAQLLSNIHCLVHRISLLHLHLHLHLSSPSPSMHTNLAPIYKTILPRTLSRSLPPSCCKRLAHKHMPTLTRTPFARYARSLSHV